jgi:hypothetical protein
MNPDEAKRKIQNAVRGFIGTLSDTCTELKKENVLLTEKNNFKKEMATALIYRMHPLKS